MNVLLRPGIYKKREREYTYLTPRGPPVRFDYFAKSNLHDHFTHRKIIFWPIECGQYQLTTSTPRSNFFNFFHHLVLVKTHDWSVKR